MNDFISRIIEIDKQAREIAVDADTLKAQADAVIAKENAEYKREIDEKTEKQVEDYKLSEQKRSEQKLLAKQDFYAKTAEGFGEIAKRESEKWVDELVSRSLS